MKATILFGYMVGILWFVPIVETTVTVTIRIPVGSCSAGGRSTFSDTATAITAPSPGLSIVSPSPVSIYTPLTNGRSAIIVPSATASNGCSFQFASCLQINQNIEPNQTFTETERLTTEYCAAFCADYKFFGLQQGSFCYCGPVPPGYSVLDISACNQPCAGDPAQSCGQSSVIREYSQVTCVGTGSGSTPLQSGSGPPATIGFTSLTSSYSTAPPAVSASSTLSTVVPVSPSPSSVTSGTFVGSSPTGASPIDTSNSLSSGSPSGSATSSSSVVALSSSASSNSPTITSFGTTPPGISLSDSITPASSSGQTSAVSISSSASSISGVPFSQTNTPIPITINTTTTTSTTTTITMPPIGPTSSPSSSVSSSLPSSAGASSVSVPTQASTYALRLSRPTTLSSVGDSDIEYSLALPFSMSLYTTTDTQISITTNGLLTIGSNDTINEAYTENSTPPSSLPNAVLNPGTALVWWQYLQIVSGPSPEGVYYQIENNNAVYVEWLMEDAQGLVYQFIANYSTGALGQMSFYYFVTGDGGVDATVGIQGLDANFDMQAVEYIHGGNISPGTAVEFDTNSVDTTVGIYSDTVFNLNCFPPGGFPAGVC